eukprot:19828-Heterococcus_DN1.PRE.1
MVYPAGRVVALVTRCQCTQPRAFTVSVTISVSQASRMACNKHTQLLSVARYCGLCECEHVEEQRKQRMIHSVYHLASCREVKADQQTAVDCPLACLRLPNVLTMYLVSSSACSLDAATA